MCADEASSPTRSPSRRDPQEGGGTPQGMLEGPEGHAVQQYGGRMARYGSRGQIVDIKEGSRAAAPGRQDSVRLLDGGSGEVLDAHSLLPGAGAVMPYRMAVGPGHLLWHGASCQAAAGDMAADMTTMLCTHTWVQLKCPAAGSPTWQVQARCSC